MNATEESKVSPVEESHYCSIRSQQVGESMIGSATKTEIYLLLQYNGAWGAKAIIESGLPSAVKTHLAGLVNELPSCKVLLIRNDHNRDETGFYFFAARVSDDNASLYAFHLTDYQDLLGLDIPALLRGESQYESALMEQTLYLVCTNGRRDLCCAKFGLPVYHALDQMVAKKQIPTVWQCSHIGGHRFAVNLVSLPLGLLYGRVDLESAEEILTAERQGRVHTPNLRGRTCYPAAAQAAEQLLRDESGVAEVEAYRLTGIDALAPDKWRVTFQQKTSVGLGAIHHVSLQLLVLDEQVYQGCTLDKQTTIKRYQLVEHRIL
jgi:hypothetical protein